MITCQNQELNIFQSPTGVFESSLPSLPAFVFVFKIQSQQAGCTVTKRQQMLVLQRARLFPLIIQEHSWSGNSHFLIQGLPVVARMERATEEVVPPPNTIRHASFPNPSKPQSNLCKARRLGIFGPSHQSWCRNGSQCKEFYRQTLQL